MHKNNKLQNRQFIKYSEEKKAWFLMSSKCKSHEDKQKTKQDSISILPVTF